MSQVQKHAWFNLAVTLLTLLLMLALIPVLGPRRAQGALGFLGLLGLGVVFYIPRRGVVVLDERDAMIRCRALTVAYAVFWVIFVLVCALGAPARYGSDGSVPVMVVQIGVWVAFILVTIFEAVAVLFQYGREGNDAA